MLVTTFDVACRCRIYEHQKVRHSIELFLFHVLLIVTLRTHVAYHSSCTGSWEAKNLWKFKKMTTQSFGLKLHFHNVIPHCHICLLATISSSIARHIWGHGLLQIFTPRLWLWLFIPIPVQMFALNAHKCHCVQKMVGIQPMLCHMRTKPSLQY